MKKYFLLSIIFFLNSSFSISQWTLQKSPTTKNLKCIKAITENILWACGFKGVVLKTEDGGTTWYESTYTDVTYDNYEIEALNANVAWVIGTKSSSAESKIWKTTDKGLSWMEQWYSASSYANAMKMFDSKYGTAFFDSEFQTGEWQILITSDGGANWNKVPKTNVPPPDTAQGEFGLQCSMVSYGDNIWFTTISNVDSRIYYSTNKGLNWGKTNSLIPPATLRSLYIAPITSAKLVAIGGDGAPGFSEDGGKTWNFPNLNSIGVDVRSISLIPNTTSLIAVGLSGKSVLSTDLGIKWSSIFKTTEARHLRSVTAISRSKIWCVGDAGLIYKWTGPNFPVDVKRATEVQQVFYLYQNYPNPFNPSTSIAYGLPFESNVKVSIYDALGQVVSELINQIQAPGYYEVNWNAGNSSTGTYFYVIKAIPVNGEKEFTSFKKMMLVK